ncbi:uncharacterized protein [Montipora foliosa]|uniref:uncharacterized protein isoform X1 n=1 Tax=Montipora foliosa TaxID=591990 RepID=UPI0035F16686
MASIAGRSLRSVSRTILQITNPQCGRIASHAVKSSRLRTCQALHQMPGVSLAKQAERNFVTSVSRTVSSSFLITSVSPPSICGSLVSAGSSSDVLEGSSGEDDGLVIGARTNLEDL